MDYMQIVNKSLQNAWAYKFLWLFGFFAAASHGNGGGQSRVGDGILHIDPGLLILIIFGLLLLVIFFMIMSVLSEGALIHGISKKEFNLKTNFSDCLSAGLEKFFRILGIRLLAVIVIISSLGILALFVVPAFMTSKAIGLVTLVLLLPLFFIVIFVVIAVEGWAMRYAVLSDKKWTEAIGSGWHLLRISVGKTLGVAFSSFLTKFLFGILLIIGLVILAIPFVLLGHFNLWFGLIPGIVVALLIIIPFTAFLGTFGSSVWTMGFIEMTGYNADQKAETPVAAR